MVVLPVLSSWRPDLVVVAAGFDAADGDPIGGCKLSPQVSTGLGLDPWPSPSPQAGTGPSVVCVHE
jgi:hypothetical protein